MIAADREPLGTALPAEAKLDGPSTRSALLCDCAPRPLNLVSCAIWLKINRRSDRRTGQATLVHE